MDRLSYFCLVYYAFMHVCLLMPCSHLLGKSWPLGSRLWCFCDVVTFPIGILGQVWCLIVSVPDLCYLSYLHLSWICSMLSKSRKWFYDLKIAYVVQCIGLTSNKPRRQIFSRPAKLSEHSSGKWFPASNWKKSSVILQFEKICTFKHRTRYV